MRAATASTYALAAGAVTLALLSGCASGTSADDAGATTPTATAPATADAAAAAKAPTAVTVTCSDAGARASSTTVKATAAGVAVKASSKEPGDVATLNYVATSADSVTRFEGAVDVSSTAQTLEFPAPPGRLVLTCAREDGSAVGRSVSVDVLDPAGYYRAVDVRQVLGCEPTVIDDGAVTPARATRKDALDRLAAQLGPAGTVTIEPGPGYAEADGSVELVVKRGKGYGLATAELQPNGSWIGRVTARC